jgi:16S rRNA (guanine527-N7)-methyltransferase
VNAAQHTDVLAADRARALTLVPVSRETMARLDRVVGLLLEWQQTRNLIAASTIPQIWTRHVADSMQLLDLAPDAKLWVDLGSGGGFPGLVLACALAEKPGARVHLVESSGKKCAFLQAAIDAARLPAEVHCRRIEDFIPAFPTKPDAVTARALAPLPKLLALAYPLLKSAPRGLFPKGQDVAVELTAASKCWNIGYRLVPSRTDARGRILVIESLAPRITGAKRRPPRPRKKRRQP